MFTDILNITPNTKINTKKKKYSTILEFLRDDLQKGEGNFLYYLHLLFVPGHFPGAAFVPWMKK